MKGIGKKKSFRKRLLLKLLSRKDALLLFLTGSTGLAALWALNIDSGAGFFAAMVCILGAVGIWLTKLLMGGDRLSREVMEELRQEANQDHEHRLDDLENRLTADGDARTEGHLRALRELIATFHESQRPGETLARYTFDLLNGVDRLFERCVLSLEKTLRLWHTAQRIHSQKAREPIMEQRERIVEDVAKSIQQLGRILAEIQCLGTNEGTDESELKRIREELNQTLEVAKKVEQRIKSLDRELGDVEKREGANR